MAPPGTLHWRWSAFAELRPFELYEILRLRQRVFVVEQACVFAEIDGRDVHARHLAGWMTGDTGAADLLAAYARVFAPGILFVEASVGRIVTAPEVRRMGLGRALMQEALRRTAELAPGAPIRLTAQLYLERFYESYGFRRDSVPYDEDGILHIEMLGPALANTR